MANIFDTLLGNYGGEIEAGTGNVSQGTGIKGLIGEEAGTQIANMFSDPNILQAMGAMGAETGGEGSFADIVGRAAVNLSKQQQMQKAATKQMEQRQNLGQSLIEALRSGNLLTEQGDLSGADSVTFDNKGGYKVTGGGAEESKLGTLKSLTDNPIEMKTEAGQQGLKGIQGVNVPNKLDRYSKLGGVDLLPLW